MLLAVDPGNQSGVAYFIGGVLVYAGTVKRGSPRDWLAWVHSRVTEVVTERPQIYRPKQSKGDPETLVPMLFQVGWLECLAAQLDVPFRAYFPRDWKGQLSKEVCGERIRTRLRSTETMPTNHNAIDAVGIGLFHLGRYR